MPTKLPAMNMKRIKVKLSDLQNVIQSIGYDLIISKGEGTNKLKEAQHKH